MDKRTVLGCLVALILLGAASFNFFSGREHKIELNPYQALGTVAAEETLKLMGDRGQIVVAAQDTGEYEMPALAAQLKAFQAAAQKKPNVTVALEKIVMDPMMMMTTGGRLPVARFLKILAEYPKAGGIVVFLGFPQLSGPDLDALEHHPAKVVVVAAYRADYQALLERRLIDLAIVPRLDALPETAQKPRNLREWFDQEYVILAADKPAASPR